MPTLLLTAGLTIVAALLLPQVGLNDHLTGALSPVIGGIPAAMRLSTQRRSGAGARGSSPGLVTALLALGVIVADSLVGLIIGSVMYEETPYGYVVAADESTGLILSIIGVVVIGLGLGALAKRLGPAPYKWLAIAVTMAFVARLIILMLFLTSVDIPVSAYLDGSTLGVYVLYYAGFFVVAAMTAAVRAQQTGHGPAPLATVPAPNVPGVPGQPTPQAHPAPPSVPGQPTPPAFPAPAAAPAASAYPAPPPPPPTSAPVALTPPGWYPDPVAPGSLRYWDGTQWTPHQHRPQ